MTQGEIQPPQVAFQSLALGRPTSRGLPGTVTLRLTNPNTRALNLQGYDCELWLEGQKVARTAGGGPVNLPGHGQTVAQVPVLVKLPAVVSLLPVLLNPEQPPLHYRVSGGFRLGAVLGGLIRVPFHFTGQLTAKEGLERLRLYLRQTSNSPNGKGGLEDR